MIQLIVDSTCDVNDAMRQDPLLDIIPLSVVLDGTAYLDGEEISLEAVYDYMRQGGVPKTQQISYESLTRILDRNLAAGNDMIYLSFSSEMSGTYQFGKMVMEEYQEKHPDTRFAIVDSRGGCGGSGLLAYETLRRIRENRNFDEILDDLQFMIEHLHYHFTLANLQWLTLGGRLHRSISFVGDKLNLKPYLTVEDGRIVSDKLVRGRKKALNTIVQDVLKDAGAFTNQTIAISHTDDAEAAAYLDERLRESLPEAKILQFQVGAVLGAHLGIGGVAAFVFDADAAERLEPSH